MIDPIIIFDLVGRRIAIGREEIKEVSEEDHHYAGRRPTVGCQRITIIKLYDGRHYQTDESVESLTQRINRFHPDAL